MFPPTAEPAPAPTDAQPLPRQSLSKRADKILRGTLGPAYEPAKDLASLLAACSPGADFVDMGEGSRAVTEGVLSRDPSRIAEGVAGIAGGLGGIFLPGSYSGYRNAAKGTLDAVESAADGLRHHHEPPGKIGGHGGAGHGGAPAASVKQRNKPHYEITKEEAANLRTEASTPGRTRPPERMYNSEADFPEFTHTRKPIDSKTWATMPENGYVDPERILTLQKSNNQKFKDKQNVLQLVQDFQRNPAHEIPPIKIVEIEGEVYALDHRRLVAARLAGVKVPYEKVSISRNVLKEIRRKDDGMFNHERIGIRDRRDRSAQ